MFEIDVEKNVRELLVNTIFAHPDDVRKPVKATAIKKKTKAKEE